MRAGRSLVAGIVAALALAATAGEPPPDRGDARSGRALFIGERPLRNGGAPCGACHAVGGEGPAFAASFGPELSGSFEGMEPDAVDGLLQDLPFPSMAPVYAGRPLAPQERADLAAFLLAAAGRPAPGGARVAIEAAAVAALLLGALLFPRRRAGSVRSRLVRAAGRPSGEAP